jgi:hypothetical protein
VNKIYNTKHRHQMSSSSSSSSKMTKRKDIIQIEGEKGDMKPYTRNDVLHHLYGNEHRKMIMAYGSCDDDGDGLEKRNLS